MGTKHSEFSGLAERLDELVDTIAELETWSPSDLGLKLSEETGELAELIFIAQGMKNKEPDEPLEGEVADVINCAIAVLVRVLTLQGCQPDEIKTRLMDSMYIKNLKYMDALKNQKAKMQNKLHGTLLTVDVITPNRTKITAYLETYKGIDMYVNVDNEDEGYPVAVCEIVIEHFTS